MNPNIRLVLLHALALNFVSSDAAFEEFETFPIPLSNLVKTSASSEELPSNLLLETEYFLYDMRMATNIHKVVVTLDHSDCRDLSSVNLLVSNSTRREKSYPIGSIICENSDFENDAVSMAWENVAYARFVRIEFTSSSSGDSAVLRGIDFYTRESPMKRIGHPNITEKISPKQKNTKYLTFDERFVRKIVLKMNETFDLQNISNAPELQVLFISSKEKSPNFGRVLMKPIANRYSFEALFDESFRTHKLKIRNHEDVTGVILFGPGKFEKLVETKEGTVTLPQKERILKIEFPDIDKNAPFKGYLLHDQNGKREILPIFSKTNSIETHIYTNKIQIQTSDEMMKHFIVYTTPCIKMECLNKGFCMVRSDFKEGYGCHCSKEFSGTFCEQASEHLCKDLSDEIVQFDKDSYFSLDTVNYECLRGDKPKRELICLEEGLFDTNEEEYVSPKDLC